jgi:hypothetical protein
MTFAMVFLSVLCWGPYDSAHKATLPIVPGYGFAMSDRVGGGLFNSGGDFCLKAFLTAPDDKRQAAS